VNVYQIGAILYASCTYYVSFNIFRADKHKVHLVAGHEGPEGKQRCSSTLFLSLALDGGGWSMSWPWPLYSWERLGTHCTGGWVGPGHLHRCRKSCPPLGFNPQTVQPVASHYTIEQ